MGIPTHGERHQNRFAILWPCVFFLDSMMRNVELRCCRMSGRSDFDLTLEHVVQHFVFVHCSEVISGGETVRQRLKVSLRVGVFVSWYGVFFLRE